MKRESEKAIVLLTVLVMFVLGATTHSHAFEVETSDREYTVNILFCEQTIKGGGIIDRCRIMASPYWFWCMAPHTGNGCGMFPVIPG